MITLTKPDYNEHMEAIKVAYEPKILALLDKIRAMFVAEDFLVSETVDLCGDDFDWAIDVRRAGDPDERSVSINVEIVEQRLFEGAGWGVSFRIDAHGWGGLIVGGVAPFNYTPQVWVDSRRPENVAERWSLLDEVDLVPLTDLVADHTDREEEQS